MHQRHPTSVGLMMARFPFRPAAACEHCEQWQAQWQIITAAVLRVALIIILLGLDTGQDAQLVRTKK